MRYDGKRDGIEYFALATTGGHLFTELPEAGFLHHYNLVCVREGEISVTTIPVGEVIDTRSITGEFSDEISGLLKSGAQVEVPELRLEPDGSFSGKLEAVCKKPRESTDRVHDHPRAR